MNSRLEKLSIPVLRWTLGLVVLLQSVHFVLAHSSARHLSEGGLPQWIRPVLGGSEIIGALLFLLPGVSLVGGYLLLIIFAVAALLHVLHGDPDVGGLIVYCAAVLVCISHRDERRVKSSRE
jgi:DoxX-like family